MTHHQINSRQAQPSDRKIRKGFTLVEILVVIAIIGILAALAIPAINGVVRRARSTAMKTETNSIERALGDYLNKYGDYPPDFSDWTTVERHYRKVFPRISNSDIWRLRLLLDVTPGNDSAATTGAMPTFGAHDGARMNRAEALVWALGGYSSDIQFPFTGVGGPLELVGTAGGGPVYQINMDRDNGLFDFEPQRTDLVNLSAGAASPTNRNLSGDGDLFVEYAAAKNGAPYVYFDSRTYGIQATYYDSSTASTETDFNGYGSSSFGFVRPFLSTQRSSGTPSFTTLAGALSSWQFVNPDTFQVLAPGPDGNFGSTAGADIDTSQSGNTANDQEPLYFQYPSGLAIVPTTAATDPTSLFVSNVKGFKESSLNGVTENFCLDNLTNFAGGPLEDEVPAENAN